MKWFDFLLFAIAAIIPFSSCQEPVLNTDPNHYLSPEQQADFLYSIIRYHGKLAPKSNHQTKFDEKFDGYYRQLAAKHELVAYYPHPKDSFIYFMTYRIAPSIHVKKVACAGKIKINPQGDIVYYEEIFRTWKMPIEELDQKSSMLFARMVKNKDLSPYLPQNSGKEEYIEFPDPNTYFDTEKRRWISTLENPLEPFYRLDGEQ